MPLSCEVWSHCLCGRTVRALALHDSLLTDMMPVRNIRSDPVVFSGGAINGVSSDVVGE